MVQVFVIILNWNGWRNTKECLESLYESDYPNFKTILVDNGSTDDSLLRIKEWKEKNMADNLFVLETGKNLGFSGGNNRGIKYALENGADYLLLLNNDIVLQKDTISKLLSLIEKDKKIGAVFPKILDENGNLQVPVEMRPPQSFLELLLAKNIFGILTPSFTYRKYLEKKNPFKNYKYDKVIKVPNIVIGSALYRKELFEKIGLLDENIFLTFEENILMEKIKKTDFQVFFTPFTFVIHKHKGDAQKLPEFLFFTEKARSEIYYATNFLKLGFVKILLLKFVNLLLFFYYCLRSYNFLKNFPCFLKRYLLWKIPKPHIN